MDVGNPVVSVSVLTQNELLRPPHSYLQRSLPSFPHSLSLINPRFCGRRGRGRQTQTTNKKTTKKLSPHFPDADDAKEEGKVKVGESPLFNQKFVFPHGEIIFSPKLYAVHNIKVQNILNMANLGRSVLVSKGGKTQRNVNVKSIAVDFGIVL